MLLEITKEECVGLRKTFRLTADYFENEPILMGKTCLIQSLRAAILF